MANNRMFIRHNPTGKIFGIGKRMGWGWYSVKMDMKAQLNAFFDDCLGGCVKPQDQDDFSLILEDTMDLIREELCGKAKG